jgi:hypothetical protein
VARGVHVVSARVRSRVPAARPCSTTPSCLLGCRTARSVPLCVSPAIRAVAVFYCCPQYIHPRVYHPDRKDRFWLEIRSNGEVHVRAKLPGHAGSASAIEWSAHARRIGLTSRQRARAEALARELRAWFAKVVEGEPLTPPARSSLPSHIPVPWLTPRTAPTSTPPAPVTLSALRLRRTA